MTSLPIIDAHHHLWDLDGGPLYYPWLQDPVPHEFFWRLRGLRHSYLPDDYRRDSAGLNIVATVHVEAECDRAQQRDETRWLASVAERHGMPDAIVAHAWFHTPESAEVLQAQAAHPMVRGIRSKPLTSASPRESVAGRPGSMQDPAWLAGFARLRSLGLSWDLRVPAWHLPEAAEVCAQQWTSRWC
ncbi:MAG: hypothetical protein R3E83_16790 [Burkholderiaceae bacterium]